MVKTLKNLEDEKTELLRKNPHLKGFRVRNLSESGATFEDLSDFIENCWTYDYADEVRMRFTPEFLKYISGKDSRDLVGVVAEKDNEIVGVELGVRRNFENLENELIGAYIGTGMSILPSKRGNRINQLLWLRVQEEFINNGASLALGWIDERHNWEGSSNKIYTQKSNRVEYHTSVPLYVKSLEINLSAELGGLRNYEKTGLKAINTIFPNKKKSIRGMDIKLFTPDYAEKCSNFIYNQQYDCDFRMVMDPDELAHKYTFSEGNLDSIMFMLLHNDKVEGIFSGFAAPVKDKNRYFQVDLSLLGEDASYCDNRAFLSTCHANLYEDYGCFGIILPKNITNKNLLKHGYIPLETQAKIGNLLTDDNIGYDPSVHNNLYLDLR